MRKQLLIQQIGWTIIVFRWRLLGLSRPRVRPWLSVRTQPPTAGRANKCQIYIMFLIKLIPYSCVKLMNPPLVSPADTKRSHRWWPLVTASRLANLRQNKASTLCMGNVNRATSLLTVSVADRPHCILPICTLENGSTWMTPLYFWVTE